MKSITKTALIAVALIAGSIASQAQAKTVWHFPYKGAPYATQTAPTHNSGFEHNKNPRGFAQ